MARSRSRGRLPALAALCAAVAVLGAARADEPDPPGWQLVWSDDFDAFDEAKWKRVASSRPTNHSRHAYLPEQVTVSDGKLVLLSENKPAEGLPYRSGHVISQQAQRLGRWEIRAQLPTTRGMWPAIWLLPDARWPSQGEIDIMENRGNQPTITSSAFHWGTTQPYFHDFHAAEQQTSIAGRLVDYSQGFHTYAVDWFEDQLRFYVDGVHHATFYNDEVGEFLPRQSAPMRLLINTAIGGDFLPPPDESTVWPQRLLVDWVRVYKAADEPAVVDFTNGDFEAHGGSLVGWHVFGNRVSGNPNVLVHNEAVHGGQASLKVFGQFEGDENFSGASQGVSVKGGDRVTARLYAQVRSTDGFAGGGNRASMKIEFYNRQGDYFGGPAMLSVAERVIADGTTKPDAWHEHELAADAPAGAVEARLSIVLAQQNSGPGAVHVDDVQLRRSED